MSEPGKGSCFTLRIPLSLPTENQGEHDVQAAA
jgi:signal transduction histidine kinase